MLRAACTSASSQLTSTAWAPSLLMSTPEPVAAGWHDALPEQRNSRQRAKAHVLSRGGRDLTVARDAADAAVRIMCVALPRSIAVAALLTSHVDNKTRPAGEAARERRRARRQTKTLTFHRSSSHRLQSLRPHGAFITRLRARSCRTQQDRERPIGRHARRRRAPAPPRPSWRWPRTCGRRSLEACLSTPPARQPAGPVSVPCRFLTLNPLV
jgi:hypothetical protein